MANEKGLAKYWTPETERFWQAWIDTAPNFVAKHWVRTLGDALKYDHRSKEYKRAMAQSHLRLITFTDKECEMLAILEKLGMDRTMPLDVSEDIKEVKERRNKALKKGVTPRELEVR